MSTPKTPISLSASDRQKQLSARDMRPSADELRARLEGARSQPTKQDGHPLIPEHRLVNASANLRPGDEFDKVMMVLDPNLIQLYDRNPRRSINPEYENIKGSIRVKGVLTPIPVTRRPGSTDYMVYGGGNTRLKILQELLQEHPDNLLYTQIQVVYHVWRGEADVLTAHLIENEFRGDTTFWDKAGGLMQLKADLESETGQPLSFHEVRARAEAMGWKVSRETVSLYEFAQNRLIAIGTWLTYSSTKLLRDRAFALTALMKRISFDTDDQAFWQLFNEELEHHMRRLQTAEAAGTLQQATEVDATAICNALDERVAQAAEVPVPALRQMLAILSSNPQISAGQLRAEAFMGLNGRLTTSTSKATSASNEATETQAPSDNATADEGKDWRQARQMPLPTGMLAPVRTPQASAAAGTEGTGAISQTHSALTGLPSLDNQGELPEDLLNDASTPAQADDVHSPELEGLKAVFAAAQALAKLTDNMPCFRLAPQMPLGFVMELPSQDMAIKGDPALIAHQRRVCRGGWQWLAMLSGQFDRRLCQEPYLSADSPWLRAVQAGELPRLLPAYGLTVHNDDVQLSGDALFFLFTEARTLRPAVLTMLQALDQLQTIQPKALPSFLDWVTTPQP